MSVYHIRYECKGEHEYKYSYLKSFVHIYMNAVVLMYINVILCVYLNLGLLCAYLYQCSFLCVPISRTSLCVPICM